MLRPTIFAIALFSACTSLAQASSKPVALPVPAADAAESGATEVAILAGGCFWGVQAVYQHVDGVSSAVSGYAGGDEKSAFYQTVSSGRTDHAEAVRITYDPKKISYGRLLQIFFSVVHDPTELNRQGPDIGRHYRSTIFPVNAAQADTAKNYIAQLDQTKIFGKPIVTTLESGKSFYPAENYHQDFLYRNPNNRYIVVNDLPKISNLERFIPDVYRGKPKLVADAGN